MNIHFDIYLPFLGIPLIAWGILIVSMIIDYRRFRNSVFLLVAIFATLFFIATLAGDKAIYVIAIMAGALFFILLCVPFVLIANGVNTMKKEGASLPNALSLLFGIVIMLGEIAAFTSLFGVRAFGETTPYFMMFSISVIYISVLFVCFMSYSLFIESIPKRRDFDFVIIHGCGLLHGDKVTKLLAGRLDKAIAIYKKDKTPPMMITSGGQGPDETVSEAHAMALYLMKHGIPEDHIIEEDQSPDTMVNLINSKKIIESFEGRRYTALVSSNYHVYRCLSYARKIGLKCTGIGSRTALYYWPSALIREFVAIALEKKHLAMIIAGWLLLMSPFIYSLMH